jgi:transposase
LTEACDEDAPHLITHVATTPAPIADETMLVPIHEELEHQDLLLRRNSALFVPECATGI